MKDKNIEEKAKEYAKLACSNFIELYNVLSRDQLIEFAATDYLQGYAAAIADQSNTLNQHKEALREVISRYDILERSVMVHPDYVFGDDNDEWHTFIDCGKELLNEAKQLLTDNTQDNENN